MKFYNRNGMLYARINGRRVSTTLKDTKENRKLFMSYAKNEEFFKKFNVKKEVPKVIDLCAEVLSKKERTIKHTTYKTYESIYKTWILPYFDKYVNEIDPNYIFEWYEKFTDKSTLTTATAIIKPSFELAIIREYIKHTPLQISKPSFESNYEINPFSIDEMKQILSQDNLIRNILGIAFFTGMRIGEIIGLKWQDIDFENETIDIQRTITKGSIQTPKTKGSKAKIELTIESLPFFQNQRRKTGLREWVFYNTYDKHFTGAESVSFHYRNILEDLGIEHRGIHQTRHTFASQMLSNGVRLEWVSFMLRHDNTYTTQKHYYKYIPKEKEKRAVLDLGLTNLTQNRHSS